MVHLPMFSPGGGAASRSSRVSPRIACARCSPPASYLSIKLRSNAMENLLCRKNVVPDQRDPREDATEQRDGKDTGAHVTPPTLRAVAHRQAPGDRRRPEAVGKVVARGENTNRINQPGDDRIRVHVRRGARGGVFGNERQ